MYFRVWLNFVLPVFRPLERAVIEAWIGRLDESTRLAVMRQLKRVNYVQRHDGGREVCMYSIKYGFFRVDPPNPFPASPRELKLAVTRFKAGDGAAVTAELWAVDGHLFSLDFDRSPRKIADQTTIEVIDIDMHPAQEATPDASQLPRDYLQLATGAAGQAEFEGAQIFAVPEIYLLKVAGRKFYALAEFPGFGMLAVSSAKSDRQVYLLTFENGSPRPMSESFRDAVQRVRAEYAREIGLH